MKKLPIILALLFILVLGVFAITGKFNGSTDNTNGKLKVAASFAPVTDLVRQVGGDLVDVVQILPSGSSPHTYEPVAKDQEALIGVKLGFVIGHDLDSWADGMLSSAAPLSKLIILDNNITLLDSTDIDDGIKDPHYWLSYTNAEAMVRTINSALAEANPANKDQFQKNADVYLIKLEQAKTEALAKTKDLPYKKFITFHAAFNYLAKELGLEVVASIEEFPGQEPTPQYLAEVGNLIKQYKVKTLFKEPQLSDSIVTALAQDYGAKVETLDPEGGLDNTATYLDMMSYNIDTIVKALK